MKGTWKHLRACVTIAVVCTVQFCATTAVLAATDWEEKQSKRFTVYTAGGKASASEILKKAESLTNRIFRDLKLRKPMGFWERDDRVKIYVHKDRADYEAETRAPQWASAVGRLAKDERTIHTYDAEDRLLTNILPHQIAHLIFSEAGREEEGRKEEMPFWIREGYARGLQAEYWGAGRYADEILSTHAESPGMFNLATIRTAPYSTGKAGSGVRYTPDEERMKEESAYSQLFFIRSVSLVSFMIKKYGANGFAQFLKVLREEKAEDNDAAKERFEKALKKMNSKVRSQENLQEAWRKSVRRK